MTPAFSGTEQESGEKSATVTIRSRKGVELFDISELWAYRELLGFLAWRDLKVRYKQTVIGVAWAVLQPLAMMTVFAIFFGRLARLPSDGLPYPLFALAALIPWGLFSRVLASSSDSLVRDQGLITKVYFPRILVPLSSGLAALVDFAISLTLLVALMVVYRVVPDERLLILPLLTILLFVAALGVGFWLSALNVEFRDVQHMLPFITQLWFFLTPVVYPASLVPDNFRTLYALNPMVGVVEGFRWSLLGTAAPLLSSVLISAISALVLCVTGLFYFRSRERGFADSLG